MDSIWFKDLKNDFDFNDESLNMLTKYISSNIMKNQSFNCSLPDNVKNDFSPRIVVLSVCDANTKSKIFIGNANGILNSVDEAIGKVKKLGLENICWVKVDFVVEGQTNVCISKDTQIKFKENDFSLANVNSPDMIILREEIIYNKLFNNDGYIDLDSCVQYFKEEFHLLFHEINENFKSWVLFKKRSFCIVENNVLNLDSSDIDLSKENILSSIKNAAMYLTRSIDASGKFNYIYDPILNKTVDSYNLLRHCGAVYSLLEAYELLKEEIFLNSAILGIEYIQDSIKAIKHDTIKSSVLVQGNSIKLGGNALALLAMAKYTKLTNDNKYKEVMENLATWIKYSQDDSGNFTIHMQSYSSGRVLPIYSDYYPGEAIFALLRLYAIDKNKDWLNVSKLAVEYIINNMAELSIENHHHWLMYALNELYDFVEDKRYFEHSLKIADSIISVQNKGGMNPGYFGTLSSSTATAARVEGLLATYKLLQKANYVDSLDYIRESILSGVSFQIKTQLTPSKVMYFDCPKAPNGAFSYNWYDPTVRIDFVQHNISALVNLYSIL